MTFFHSLHFRAESIADKKESKSTNVQVFTTDDTLLSLLNVSAFNKHAELAIKPFRLPKFEEYSIKKEKNCTTYSGERLKVVGSMIFRRGPNYISFIDPFSQYKIFEKNVNTKSINLTTSNTLEEIEEPAKIKLINYQKLAPNPKQP